MGLTCAFAALLPVAGSLLTELRQIGHLGSQLTNREDNFVCLAKDYLHNYVLEELDSK